MSSADGKPMKAGAGILRPGSLELKDGPEWLVQRPAWARFGLLSIALALFLLEQWYGRRLWLKGLQRTAAAADLWTLLACAGAYLALLSGARWKIAISGPKREVSYGLFVWEWPISFLPSSLLTVPFSQITDIRVDRAFSLVHGRAWKIDMIFPQGRDTRRVLRLLLVSNRIEADYLADRLGELIGCPVAKRA